MYQVLPTTLIVLAAGAQVSWAELVHFGCVFDEICHTFEVSECTPNDKTIEIDFCLTEDGVAPLSQDNILIIDSEPGSPNDSLLGDHSRYRVTYGVYENEVAQITLKAPQTPGSPEQVYTVGWAALIGVAVLFTGELEPAFEGQIPLPFFYGYCLPVPVPTCEVIN